ncbi:reverse transcriptase domain-containing protein [Tanacetum coccineum]
MHFSDGEITHNEEVDIRIRDKILQPKESFRYHGSMLHTSERIDEDVSNRIKAAWMKWRAATGVLCDRNVPLKLKGKFYRVAIRPAMLYESECRPITKALANMVEVAELRMLRWTCGKTLLDMIPNGVYRAQLEVETIINKMREGLLRVKNRHFKIKEQGGHGHKTSLQGLPMVKKSLGMTPVVDSKKNRDKGIQSWKESQGLLLAYPKSIKASRSSEKSTGEAFQTYDGSGDPEDHLKLFQSGVKTERWAMPTWCHMFNSTLTGNARVWFDKLPKEESIDSYEDLRATFRENYLQQTKHIKDPMEIHHIKQRDGESTEVFMERYKAEVLDVEGAPKCMKISGFMHRITHPELIKHLYEKIPRSMEEMNRVTASFLQGKVAAFSHRQKKAHAPWRQPEGGCKPNFKKGFKNKQRPDRKPDRFSLLTKTPKEIFALEKGKFKAPPPMVTPTKKMDPNKYCEFHSDTGHSTDECMQLRKQIEEMIKSGKLSQFIKEFKQNDKPKAPKKGETAGKDKPLAILMAPARNKKPDDPSYHTTHQIQWGNHLVARPDIPTSKDRTGIRKICAVPSTAHEMLKFPIEGGTVTLQSSRVILMECAMISGPSTQHPMRSSSGVVESKVAIHPEYPEQTIAI